MKKLMLMAISAVLFSTACSEEEQISPTAENVIQVKETSENNKANVSGRKLWCWATDRGGDCDCFWVPKNPNCLDRDVVLTPSIAGGVDDVFDAVGSGVQANYQTEFINHEGYFKSIIDANLVDDVINGNILLMAKFNTENNNRYLLFVNEITDEEPILAVPFVE